MSDNIKAMQDSWMKAIGELRSMQSQYFEKMTDMFRQGNEAMVKMQADMIEKFSEKR